MGTSDVLTKREIQGIVHRETGQSLSELTDNFYEYYKLKHWRMGCTVLLTIMGVLVTTIEKLEDKTS